MSNENFQKVVITGAGGFLGSNLLAALKGKTEYIVYALSSSRKELPQADARSNVWFYHKDAIFCDGCDRILRGAIVVNCAFPRNSIGTEMADGLRYIQRLFKQAKEYGAKSIINISSQSVYSQTREEPATEGTPVCLESAYAVGKYATELMLESVCQGAKISYTNLRMASLIGPGFDQRIVNRFIKQALSEHSLSVNISKQKFGFMDIGDAVSGIIVLLQPNQIFRHTIYNLGTPNGYSLEDLASRICSIAAKICQLDIHVDFTYLDSNTNTTINCERFYNDFSWRPKISLETSIEKIINCEVEK